MDEWWWILNLRSDDNVSSPCTHHCVSSPKELIQLQCLTFRLLVDPEKFCLSKKIELFVIFRKISQNKNRNASTLVSWGLQEPPGDINNLLVKLGKRIGPKWRPQSWVAQMVWRYENDSKHMMLTCKLQSLKLRPLVDPETRRWQKKSPS